MPGRAALLHDALGREAVHGAAQALDRPLLRAVAVEHAHHVAPGLLGAHPIRHTVGSQASMPSSGASR